MDTTFKVPYISKPQMTSCQHHMTYPKTVPLLGYMISEPECKQEQERNLEQNIQSCGMHVMRGRSPPLPSASCCKCKN